MARIPSIPCDDRSAPVGGGHRRARMPVPAGLAALALTAAMSVPAAAQDLLDRLQGAYLPAGTLPSAEIGCSGPMGVPGGSIGIEGNRLMGLENACTLRDPVAVRGMDAQLFDTECTGEGMTYDGGRVLLMATPDGLVMLRDGIAVNWHRCPG